jgi:hypothetical protein
VAFDVLLSTVMKTIAAHELVTVVGGATIMSTGSLEKDNANNAASFAAIHRGRELCERFAGNYAACMEAANKPYDYYPTHPVSVPDPK